jgi:hypothetical protein
MPSPAFITAVPPVRLSQTFDVLENKVQSFTRLVNVPGANRVPDEVPTVYDPLDV